MVAVVVVVVAVTALIQDCAKADGVTRTTSSGRTANPRTRTNLDIAPYRNDPQPEERGGSASSVSLNFLTMFRVRHGRDGVEITKVMGQRGIQWKLVSARWRPGGATDVSSSRSASRTATKVFSLSALSL